MKNLKILVVLMLVLSLTVPFVGAGAETVLRFATDPPKTMFPPYRFMPSPRKWKKRPKAA